MTADLTRPRLHLTPLSGWINDPLGLTVREGTWHVFVQFVPGQVQWSPEQHWGHATSPDGLLWTEGPVALEPGDGDGGVWSGSIVEPEGEPAALFYTTVELAEVEVGKVRVARAADPDWSEWTKGRVVAELPSHVKAVAYRDPYVFHDGRCWRMLMGAGLADGHATALVYRSVDLQEWSFDGLLAKRHQDEREPLWTGIAWECPQLFRLEDRWVLTVSVWEPGHGHHEAYAVGDYADGRFTPAHWDRLTFGSYYAGSTFVDGAGARGLVHWLRGVADPAGRWAGAMSVPHAVRLDGDRLILSPHPFVAARRGQPTSLSDGRSVHASSTCDVQWSPTNGARLLVADAEGARLFELTADPDELVLDAEGRREIMPWLGGPLRMLLDGPVIEVFQTAGVLAVPIPARSARITITAQGGEGEVFDLLVARST